MTGPAESNTRPEASVTRPEASVTRPEVSVTRPEVLITRPEDDAAPLMEALSGLGYAPLPAPLLRMVWLDDAPFDPADATGVLLTSANGVRALARRAATLGVLSHVLSLPAYAVGDATAAAARRAGFRQVDSAGGDVVALARLTAALRRPEDGPLLHVAGTDVAGDLAALLGETGFCVRRATLYRAVVADSLAPAAVAALIGGTVAAAVFFSPRTARSFARLTVAAGVAGSCARVVAYCLSPAVADALRTPVEPAGGTGVDGTGAGGTGAGGTGDAGCAPVAIPWRDIRCADAPEQARLLALIPPAVGRNVYSG